MTAGDKISIVILLFVVLVLSIVASVLIIDNRYQAPPPTPVRVEDVDVEVWA